MSNGLPARLRSRRAYHGWTQAELAERADLSTNQVARLERGESSDPKQSTLTGLADALDVSLDWLAYGERRE